MADAVELVDTTRDALDDVWRQTEHDPYPETRMQHLMDVIGMALQVMLKGLVSNMCFFP